jgi:hypothetical protein
MGAMGGNDKRNLRKRKDANVSPESGQAILAARRWPIQGAVESFRSA